MGKKVTIELTFDKDFDADLLLRIVQRANGGSPEDALYTLLNEWRAIELYKRGEKPYRIKSPRKNKEVAQKGPEPGYVYIIQADISGSPCKIGMSKNVPDRIRTFSVKLPFAIKLIHFFPCDNPRKAESVLHKIYTEENKKINGEWFQLNERDVEYLTKIAEYKELEFILTGVHNYWGRK